MQFLRTIGSRFSEARRRYKAFAELMDLDDRTLADIGLTRSEVKGAVFGDFPAYQNAVPARVSARPVVAANLNSSRRAA